jgi:hypothetical protein
MVSAKRFLFSLLTFLLTLPAAAQDMPSHNARFWPAIPEDTAQALKEKTDDVKVRTPRPKAGQ